MVKRSAVREMSPVIDIAVVLIATHWSAARSKIVTFANFNIAFSSYRTIPVALQTSSRLKLCYRVPRGLVSTHATEWDEAAADPHQRANHHRRTDPQHGDGRLEMAYSVLLPCIFSVYLHPDDHARLVGVQDLIREDARRALNARMAEWNGKNSTLFKRGVTRKQYKIAQNDWWIELFADAEGAVPPGDVEIHSELNDVVQPGYRGAKTTLIEREPSVTSARVARDRESTRGPSSKVFAEIRYQDDWARRPTP